jgi:hypothetical protein
MTTPLQFPDPREEARKRGEEFQRLPADERVRQILDTIESGLILIRHSPNRQKIEEMQSAREAEWQRIQAELFRNHGR